MTDPSSAILDFYPSGRLFYLYLFIIIFHLGGLNSSRTGLTDYIPFMVFICKIFWQTLSLI